MKWLQPNCADSVCTICGSGKSSANWIIRTKAKRE